KSGKEVGSAGGPSAQTTEALLMQLIRDTIEPGSWSDNGGPGTLEYYPTGMALVVCQTPSVQEQVEDLLAALRRLQDVQVVVEVRLMTVADSFFERIGVDFEFHGPAGPA